jgi:hypothetical protein
MSRLFADPARTLASSPVVRRMEAPSLRLSLLRRWFDSSSGCCSENRQQTGHSRIKISLSEAVVHSLLSKRTRMTGLGRCGRFRLGPRTAAIFRSGK